MKPRVKICGITNLKDALYCTDAGADALGFIFYKKSSRYIEPDKAALIIKELPRYITPVGVFVNERRANIKQVVLKTRLKIIQLSGDETPTDCTGFSTKVWKTFRIREQQKIEYIKEYSISAAMLDGATNSMYGGSGILADFSVALAMKDIHPLILAGGLNTDNILQAIQTVQPFAVDINSGVESAPGKKDHSKIALLFQTLSHVH